MARSQNRSVRKVSGTKYKSLRKKRLNELGDISALTSIGKKRAKLKRVRGGNTKQAALADEYIVVNDGKKAVKLKIENVENNPANIHYTRRNIITKGCIVKTDKGNVRVTSRPGQSGGIFGVFVK